MRTLVDVRCWWQLGTTRVSSTNWKFVATGAWLLIEVAGLCRRTLVVVDVLARAISHTLNKLENSFYGWRYERFPACRGFDVEVSSGRGSKPAVCRANWTLVVVDLLGWAISRTLNKLENSFYGWSMTGFAV